MSRNDPLEYAHRRILGGTEWRPRNGRSSRQKLDQILSSGQILGADRVLMANGLRSLGAKGHPDPIRDGIVKVIVTLDALGAAPRKKVQLHTKMDGAWFMLAWEEAKAHGWIGIAGYEGSAGIWALMEAGQAEVKKIGLKGERSSFGRANLDQQRQNPASGLTLGSLIE